MFQGTVSRQSVSVQASSTSGVVANTDVIELTGSTQIETITPRVAGVGSQVVWLVPTAGAVALGTSGNIAAAETCPQNKATPLVYLQSTEKWYPISAA